MDALTAVRAACGQADGVALRSHVLAAVSRKELTRAVREGSVIRVARGVYRPGPVAGTAAVRAVACALRGVVSFDSAALCHQLPMVHTPTGMHVTVPSNRRRTARRGAVIHRADLDSDAFVEVSGVRITSLLQTVLDCARLLPLRDAVVVADSALRAGLDRTALDDAARSARGPGAARVRRVVGLSDERAGSVLESVLRVLLVLAGLAPTTSQYVVSDADGFIAVADFAYREERLLVEADGFTYHSRREDYRADRRKANSFLVGEWMLLRFSWEDVLLDPDYVVSTVRAALRLRLVRAA